MQKERELVTVGVTSIHGFSASLSFDPKKLMGTSEEGFTASIWTIKRSSTAVFSKVPPRLLDLVSGVTIYEGEGLSAVKKERNLPAVKNPTAPQFMPEVARQGDAVNMLDVLIHTINSGVADKKITEEQAKRMREIIINYACAEMMHVGELRKMSENVLVVPDAKAREAAQLTLDGTGQVLIHTLQMMAGIYHIL